MNSFSHLIHYLFFWWSAFSAYSTQLLESLSFSFSILSSSSRNIFSEIESSRAFVFYSLSYLICWCSWVIFICKLCVSYWFSSWFLLTCFRVMSLCLYWLHSVCRDPFSFDSFCNWDTVFCWLDLNSSSYLVKSSLSVCKLIFSRWVALSFSLKFEKVLSSCFSCGSGFDETVGQ